MSRRRISDDERRARLGRRQILEPAEAGSATASPGQPVEELVDRLLVLHASDPATIYLSVAARHPTVTVADIDAALFERRSLLRTLAMRRTLWVATLEVGALAESSSSPAVAAAERKRLEKYLVEGGIDEPAVWLASLFDEVSQALLAAGRAADPGDEPAVDGGAGLTARELSVAVPRLATRIVAGAGTRHPMEMTTTSRVLGLMAVEGLIVRGRPAGGWTGRQYTWHHRERWWPVGQGPQRLDEEAAAAELVARWLARFGPATLDDLVWWTGWTKTRTRQALAALDTVEVELELGATGGARGGDGAELDAGPGILLADDLDEVPAPEPWAALLPALDPTAMGWKHRSWYLGPHRDRLFDRNGNIGPTVWVDGRIVGGWAQRPDGEVTVALLDDVGADHRRLVDAQVERIQAFVGDTVVKPSFPTPLQRELSAG